jgi:hypothetical protein
MSPDEDWLRTPDGEAWLDSGEGHEWLGTSEGNRWFVGTEDGLAWGRSEASARYLDGLAQQGFEAFFSGKSPATPENCFTSDSAPHIGSRVRLTEDVTTLRGTTIAARGTGHRGRVEARACRRRLGAPAHGRRAKVDRIRGALDRARLGVRAR